MIMEVTAIRQYLMTSTCVNRADPGDLNSWVQLYQLLPSLRDMLACLACGQLLIAPCRSSDFNCLHFLCEGCRDMKMMMKMACGWCKDRSKFILIRQVHHLLINYKNMCEVLQTSAIYPLLVNNSKFRVGNNNTQSRDMKEIIEEGVNYKPANAPLLISPSSSPHTSPVSRNNKKKEYFNLCIPNLLEHHRAYYNYPSYRVDMKSRRRVSSPSRKLLTTDSVNSKVMMKVSGNGNTSCQIMPQAGVKSVSVTPYHPPSISLIDKNPMKQLLDGSQSSEDSEDPEVQFKGQPLGRKPLKRKRSGRGSSGCRCGIATPSPGKLTCRGQRCVCYIAKRACVDCECRGCRNTHGTVVSSNRDHLYIDCDLPTPSSECGSNLLIAKSV